MSMRKEIYLLTSIKRFESTKAINKEKVPCAVLMEDCLHKDCLHKWLYIVLNRIIISQEMKVSLELELSMKVLFR